MSNGYYTLGGVQFEFNASLQRPPRHIKHTDWHETAHHWRVGITPLVQGQKRTEVFDYYTGIGHRTALKFMSAAQEYKRLTRYGVQLTDHGLQALLNVSRATPPTAQDVVYCLFSDMQLASQPFHEWADDLGYSTDSIKDTMMYNNMTADAQRFRSLGFDVQILEQEFGEY